MRVDFNNLRRQALHRYDALVDKLNSAIITDSQWAKPNDVHHGQEINIQGYVLIDADDIQEEMDDLRMLIGAVAATHCCDDEDFKDIFSEVYPEDGAGLKLFNNKEE